MASTPTKTPVKNFKYRVTDFCRCCGDYLHGLGRAWEIFSRRDGEPISIRLAKVTGAHVIESTDLPSHICGKCWRDLPKIEYGMMRQKEWSANISRRVKTDRSKRGRQETQSPFRKRLPMSPKDRDSKTTTIVSMEIL